jgi:hypothetical protein
MVGELLDQQPASLTVQHHERGYHAARHVGPHPLPPFAAGPRPLDRLALLADLGGRRGVVVTFAVDAAAAGQFGAHACVLRQDAEPEKSGCH